MTDAVAEYAHAIVAMAGVAVLLLLMSPVAAMRKQAQGLAPGAQPTPDYADPAYRWHRAHGNLAESLGAFVAVTVAAILAGVNPAWVNALASAFLALRVVLAVVHVAGVGRADMGPRSIIYVAGWLVCLALAGLAIWGVFQA